MGRDSLCSERYFETSRRPDSAQKVAARELGLVTRVRGRGGRARLTMERKSCVWRLE